MSTTAAKTCPVSPFSIEIDHPQNADMLIQAIEGIPRLRSRITASRTVIDSRNGEEYLPEDRSRHLGKYPEIPGMILHVNPGDCQYKITDPLTEKPDLLERIKKQLNRERVFRVDGDLKGVPDQKGVLDQHRMKTLIREMHSMLKIKHARLVKGAEPKLEDINKMEGRFLANPGCIIPNGLPRYEDEMEDYVTNLSRTGG